MIHYPQIQKYRLFNLAEDPHEIHDLADLPAYAEQRETLKTRLDQLQREMDDPLSQE